MRTTSRIALLALAPFAVACGDGPTDPTPQVTPSVVNGVWQFEVPSLVGAGLSCQAIGDSYRFTVRRTAIEAVEVPSDHYSLECSGDDSVEQIHMPGLFVGAPSGEADGASVTLVWEHVTAAGDTERMRVDGEVSGDVLEGVLTYRDARDGQRFFTGRIVGHRVTP